MEKNLTNVISSSLDLCPGKIHIATVSIMGAAPTVCVFDKPECVSKLIKDHPDLSIQIVSVDYFTCETKL